MIWQKLMDLGLISPKPWPYFDTEISILWYHFKKFVILKCSSETRIRQFQKIREIAAGHLYQGIEGIWILNFFFN